MITPSQQLRKITVFMANVDQTYRTVAPVGCRGRFHMLRECCLARKTRKDRDWGHFPVHSLECMRVCLLLWPGCFRLSIRHALSPGRQSEGVRAMGRFRRSLHLVISPFVPLICECLVGDQCSSLEFRDGTALNYCKSLSQRNLTTLMHFLIPDSSRILIIMAA